MPHLVTTTWSRATWFSRWAIAVAGIALASTLPIASQADDTPPTSADSPSRLRIKEGEAWQAAIAALRQGKPTVADQTLAAWARSRQFDAEYYWQTTSRDEAVFAAYEKECQAGFKDALTQVDKAESFRLLAMDFEAYLGDLQPAEPDAGDEASIEALLKFRRQRMSQMQARGKLAASLYRAGHVDALTLVQALLDRQVSERMYLQLEAQRMQQDAKAELQLLARQCDEWNVLGRIAGERTEDALAPGLGADFCRQEGRRLKDRVHELEATLAGEASKESKLKSLTGHIADQRALFRKAVKLQGEGKLAVAQLARLDDFQNYSPALSDPDMPPAERLAFAEEVSAAWTSLVGFVAKSKSATAVDRAIASAMQHQAAAELAALHVPR